MASSTTKIKTIRIKNETSDYFENKPLNRMVESLGELLQSGKMSFDGENLVIKGQKGEENVPKTDISAIEEMAGLMRVPTDRLLMDFREMLEEGTLYYSNGKLINPRYEDFERACEGRDIDKILESMIRSL